MPGENLTRDEAQARAEIVDPGKSGIEYTIDLDLTTGDTTFTSITTVKFIAQQAASTWLDFIAPTVHEITFNGTRLEPAEVYDGARITLADLQEENEVTVKADAAYMRTGEGVHRFVDPVDDEVYLYTQFEVADSRRMYACFEQPDLKGTFQLTVVAPRHWQVVTNTTGTGAKTGKDSKRWKFKRTKMMSTYITALVAGPYHVVRSAYEGKATKIPLKLYCRKSLAENLDADELFDITRRGFAFFEDVFGLAYPFEKYDQLFVPEFNAGAMENAGAVTHHEDYVFRSRVTDAAYERRAETLLHEMAHMWFGDLVTMQWWNDLWLNESFATWASVLCQSEATRWTDSWTTFAVSEKLWALRQDQLPSTHPISADIRDLEDVEVNFDGITYAKGASVLKQLVAWVGRDEFLQGVRAYFNEHQWGNTTLADLFKHLEATSGRDLSDWEQQWLQTAGVNTLRPVVATDPDGNYTSVIIEQTAPSDHPVLRAHRLAVGLYDKDEDGALVRRQRVELDVSGDQTEVTELRGVKQPDLLLVNDDDLTFAKIRLDERSRETVVASIGSLPPLPRALCWTASTDMLRDAELPAREYVDLVLRGIGRETAMPVVQLVLAAAKTAIDLYANPPDRMLLSSRWAVGLRLLAGDAEPSSDEQLAFARSWIVAAASPEQVNEIRALLDGSDDVLPGLTVDTDLRWHLLQRLVVLGEAGTDEIDAELESDATATGQRQAAYARAAIPTGEAKVAAWQSVVESDELPNALLAATVRGFSQVDQRDLARPFVSPYLEAIPRVWADRTNDTAQTIITGLFPRVLADAETAAAVRSWLESTDHLPDAARRLVTEGLADLERALRAQERDRQAS